MSSSTVASQITHGAANYLPRLPPEVWMEIFRRLDIKTLLNVAETAPEWKCLAFNSAVLKTVTFAQETDVRTIMKFLLTTREEVDHGQTTNVTISLLVRELCFANVFRLPTSVILECCQKCHNLTELYCVDCLVHPAELFILLSKTLKFVTKLEWTLYEELYYDFRLEDVALRLIETRTPSEGPEILAMYVEQVLTTETVKILDSFLMRCRRLRDLHVHYIPGRYIPTITTDVCLEDFTPNKSGPLKIIDRLPTLETVKYTCEMPFATKTEGRISALRNNIAWQRKPEPSFNVVGLYDVVKQKASVRSMEQVMVTVNTNSEAASLFEEAAAQQELWEDTSRLTLVLTPGEAGDTQTPPTVHRGLMKPLGEFLKTCVSELTELNLSTCHFEAGSDCCSVVASTLIKLHALTLPPCGANLENSLEHLARGCKLLVRLEVRSVDTVSPAAPCDECKRPLLFTASCFELLHRETKLNELSIDESANIASLSFLLGCRVEELRLHLNSAKGLGPLLAANTRLSSLTIVAHDARATPRPKLDLSVLLEHVDCYGCSMSSCRQGRMEQVMVTVNTNSEAASLFEEAAAQQELREDTSRLTLVLTPGEASDTRTPPTVHRGLMKPLGEFLKTCVPALTELNLSICHFEAGSDCCSVVASTLIKLHALTLPPCAANLENSLEHLARGCKLLVRLEVRSVDTVSPAAPCDECKRPLLFTASCFELLHRKTKLNERSIDESANIASLSFLLECRVEELRLHLNSAKGLGTLLAANTRLSSLTIVAHDARVCFYLPSQNRFLGLTSPTKPSALQVKCTTSSRIRRSRKGLSVPKSGSS
ncbi:hypothetical protein HPB50_008877 [Hyalomma asiaticum]|uniref:Uncharacterized protein n=1 Tax=Hyalomma asiaticum TaxID=266040 RepID=A0ACB7THE7_HYAAI|nr:hypothetical protein HPB50_008877 [Hyalomma asiaticum]